MPYVDEHSGLEVIPLAECVRLLDVQEVGRIAFINNDTIQLYPVNYAWDGEGIIFRVQPDSVLAKSQATGGSEIIIEVDRFDDRTKTAWSLIARGTPHAVDPEKSPEMSARLARLSLYPWADGERSSWYRLIPAPLTGRRIA